MARPRTTRLQKVIEYTAHSSGRSTGEKRPTLEEAQAAVTIKPSTVGGNAPGSLSALPNFRVANSARLGAWRCSLAAAEAQRPRLPAHGAPNKLQEQPAPTVSMSRRPGCSLEEGT